MEAGDVEDSFLTVAEVAATLKLNQQTVRNWIDQGYMAAGAPRPDPGPSAEDFWSGEPVGVPEAPPEERAPRS